MVLIQGLRNAVRVMEKVSLNVESENSKNEEDYLFVLLEDVTTGSDINFTM